MFYVSNMLNPCIIITYNILILKSTLNVNFSLYSLIIFVILFAHFYHFNAVNISIDQIYHFEYFATTSLTNHLNLFEVLSVSFIWNNWKIKIILFLLLKDLIVLVLHNELIFQVIFVFKKGFCLFENHLHYIIVLQLLPPNNIFVHLVSYYFLFLFNFVKLLLH